MISKVSDVFGDVEIRFNLLLLPWWHAVPFISI